MNLNCARYFTGCSPHISFLRQRWLFPFRWRNGGWNMLTCPGPHRCWEETSRFSQIFLPSKPESWLLRIMIFIKSRGKQLNVLIYLRFPYVHTLNPPRKGQDVKLRQKYKTLWDKYFRELKVGRLGFHVGGTDAFWIRLGVICACARRQTPRFSLCLFLTFNGGPKFS